MLTLSSLHASDGEESDESYGDPPAAFTIDSLNQSVKIAKFFRTFRTSTPQVLHFFWATGHVEEDLFFGAKPNTDIGGEKYRGDVFYFKLLSLVANLPENIVVNLVTDPLTYDNNLWILDLQGKFPSKFSHQSVHEVWTILNGRFPEFESEFDSFYKNSHSGNPAITSDIFRLLGTYVAPQVQHIYCDIDLFCANLEVICGDPLQIPTFLATLFTEIGEQGINLAALPKGNDLIKLRFESDEAYNSFVAMVMANLQTFSPNRIDARYLQVTAWIREESPIEDMEQCLSQDLSLNAYDVIKTTGPGLVKRLSEQETINFTELFYRTTFTLAWTDFLPIDRAEIDHEPDAFTEQLKSYCTILKLTLHAKRYGSDRHKFQQLMKHFESAAHFTAPRQAAIQWLRNKELPCVGISQKATLRTLLTPSLVKLGLVLDKHI